MLNGKFPESWDWKRLGDITRVLRGASPRPKGNPKYYGGKIPWIKISDVTGEKGKYLTKTIDSVTDEGVKKSRYLSSGSLILSICATVCVPKILAIDGCIHDGFVYFPDFPDNLDKTFLYYFFESIRPEVIQKNRQGMTQVNLNTGIVSNFQVPIPPLPEQERIVSRIEELFSDLEAGVAALERVRAGLKRYKASVLKAACEGRLLEKGRKLGSDGLPEGWRWVKLEDVGHLGRGKSKHRPRNADFLYGGKYPFIQTGDIRHADGVITAYTQTYSDAGLAQSKLWEKGTLCITIAANIAETAILGVDACFPDSVVGFVPSDNVNVKFVEFYIRTIKDNLERYAPATAQKNINLDVLQKVEIILPPLEEQHRIVAEVERRLSVVGEIESAVEAGLLRASRLRQAILRSAFEGRL